MRRNKLLSRIYRESEADGEAKVVFLDKGTLKFFEIDSVVYQRPSSSSGATIILCGNELGRSPSSEPSAPNQVDS